MRKQYQYSPLEPGRYSCHGYEGRDDVSVITGLARGAAIWNLFWLSNPNIDRVPELGRRWRKGYQHQVGLSEAVIADAINIEHEPLIWKLTMHPDSFMDFFQRQDHTTFRLYHRGGQAWVDTVMARAEESAIRITSEQIKREGPPIEVMGNVLRFNLRAKAA